jgi:EAL domain-containing protein (putative c-di-GMP-specific phosphodiesterase class I)
MDNADTYEDLLLAAVDPMIVMRRVVEEALSAVPSAEGAVVELAAGDALTFVCAAGTLEPTTGTRLAITGSLSGLAVLTRTTMRWDASTTDDRVDAETCRRVGAVSLVCVPLQRGPEVIGALTLASSQPHAFDDNTVGLLNSLAAFISNAIASWSDVAKSAATVLGAERAATRSVNDQQPGKRRHTTPAPATDTASQFVANVLRPGMNQDRAVRKRVEAVLNGTGLTMQFQPILDLKTGRITGCEALARFAPAPTRAPDLWFADAQRVGLGPQLQLAAISKALTQLPQLPPNIYLAVNVGHDIANEPELLRLLHTIDSRRVVIELTEHLHVEDYPTLIDAISRIRATGARLAIDDTGAGFAGFSHILKLSPDLIKLDRILTTGVDIDPARQALAGALVKFAAATRAKVIAEGIETAAELDTIHQLGVDYGQGYFLGTPGPITRLISRNRNRNPARSTGRPAASKVSTSG